MDLVNKTIVVTGASDGIGKQVALRLANDKVNVLLLGRNVKRLKAVQTEIEKRGSTAVWYVCDLNKINEIKKTVEKISTKYRVIDGLINVAGVWQKLEKLENVPDQEIIDVLQTNLTGLILLTKHMTTLLHRAKEAVIVNISSRSGYSAQAGQSVYTASKYGVRGFTEVIQQDLKDSHIRVAGVYQGGTNTKMFEKAGEKWPEERYSSFIPPKELAEIVAFMISRPKHVWLPEIRIENR